MIICPPPVDVDAAAAINADDAIGDDLASSFLGLKLTGTEIKSSEFILASIFNLSSLVDRHGFDSGAVLVGKREATVVGVGNEVDA